MSRWIEKVPNSLKNAFKVLAVLAIASACLLVFLVPTMKALSYVLQRGTADLAPTKPAKHPSEWQRWFFWGFVGTGFIGWFCIRLLELFKGAPAWVRKVANVVITLSTAVVLPIVWISMAALVILLSAGLTRIVLEANEVQAVLIVLGGGAALYAFRSHLRSCYGFTEVVAGLAIGTLRYTTENPQHDANWALGILTAGIYLVVRGLDNLFTGLEDDPVAKRTRVLLQRAREFAREGADSDPPSRPDRSAEHTGDQAPPQ